MEWKDTTPDTEKSAREKKVLLRGEKKWAHKRKEADKKMCENWRRDGSGCKVYGPQARCASCAPRIDRVIMECQAVGCGSRHGLQYCPYCHKYNCACHQHVHRGDKGEILPMTVTFAEPKTVYVPCEKKVKVGKGLVLKGV